MSPKPEVVLEFDLGDVMMMKPLPLGAAGTPAPKDILLLRSAFDASRLAIYVVFDGARVVPIAVDQLTKVEIVVSRS